MEMVGAMNEIRRFRFSCSNRGQVQSQFIALKYNNIHLANSVKETEKKKNTTTAAVRKQDIVHRTLSSNFIPLAANFFPLCLSLFLLWKFSLFTCRRIPSPCVVVYTAHLFLYKTNSVLFPIFGTMYISYNGYVVCSTNRENTAIFCMDVCMRSLLVCAADDDTKVEENKRNEWNLSLPPKY